MTKLSFDAWLFVLTGVIDLNDLEAHTSIRSMALGRSAVTISGASPATPPRLHSWSNPNIIVISDNSDNNVIVISDDSSDDNVKNQCHMWNLKAKKCVAKAEDPKCCHHHMLMKSHMGAVHLDHQLLSWKLPPCYVGKI